MSHVQRHRVAEHGTRPKLQRRRSRFPQHLRDGCDQSRAIQGERGQLNLRENNCNLYSVWDSHLRMHFGVPGPY